MRLTEYDTVIGYAKLTLICTHAYTHIHMLNSIPHTYTYKIYCIIRVTVAWVIAIELKHYGIAAYNVVHKSKEVVLPQITKIIYCRGVNNIEKKRVPQPYKNG